MSHSPHPRWVFLVRTAPNYGLAPGPLPGASSVDEALRRLLDPEPVGPASGNPLGAFVRASDRVLVKPNWVSHRNWSGAGLECTRWLDSIPLTPQGKLEQVIRE
jgi:hypothetical protein